ncbi:MAG: YIP1 family protein [Clostridiales bacterium]|uniref:Yip1 family protein n=1 Tax=Clostridium sp. N3C TaxID=1776758 RepID=UPI00092DEF3C|nr:Yip1 family protein [Clostridium sp. N3C]NLZ49502.1 YIP1 family protein [Clostridiales bacterium]SCN24717.1 Yip1 domain protein [Clostridium sp. N3C]
MSKKKSGQKNNKEALKNNIKVKEKTINNSKKWAIFYKDKAWAFLLALVAGLSVLYSFIYYYFFSESKVTEIVNEQLTEEMSEAIVNNSKSFGSAFKISIMAMLTALITVLILSGLYYILVVTLRGEIKFKQMLTIYSGAYIITILGELVIEVFGKLTNSSFMAGSDPYVKVLFNQFNPFEILSLVFIFYGIKAFTRMSNKKIITTIIIVVAGTLLFNMIRVSISQSLSAI